MAAKELVLENLVVGAGIGCHGKITDYLNLNTFEGLHGRIIPVLTGIKLANPKLTALAFSGDGDSYAEGLEHLVHAARRNSDIKLIIHNNQTFALTTGQFSPSSQKGFKGKTTPAGSVEEPLNALSVLLASGATFLARSYALDTSHTKDLMRALLRHQGFGVLEIIQPCLTFNDTRDYFKDRLEALPADYKRNDFIAAMSKMKETEKTPVGIFYQVNKQTFEQQI